MDYSFQLAVRALLYTLSYRQINNMLLNGVMLHDEATSHTMINRN